MMLSCKLIQFKELACYEPHLPEPLFIPPHLPEPLFVPVHKPSSLFGATESDPPRTKIISFSSNHSITDAGSCIKSLFNMIFNF